MANIMRLGGGVGSKTTIGASYNADGTQNLVIKDDGSVIEIPDPNPVLLWTNASPTSEFAAQTIAVNGAEYSGYLIECRASTTNSTLGWVFVNIGSTGMVGAYAVETGTYSNKYRYITASSATGVTFSIGYIGVNSFTKYGIPTRIWGVKFTL